MNPAGGVPRDTDKMIRQLSLVAFFMARHGRKIDAGTIRWEVEGYGDDDQREDAFARRFYADREELRELGIEIHSEPDELGDGDVYWLAAEDFFLPPVQFSRQELAALHTCLYLLDGQFAYSRLLRLALQSLALGTGNSLEDPVAESVSVDLLSAGFDSRIAALQARLETAISRRKTIRFDYHALGRDSVEERRVDPYGIFMSRSDWYMVGRSHERDDIRVFKLRRIRGRIRNATSAEHDFERPADFDLQAYSRLEPWQMGKTVGSAEVSITPRMAWWAANNLSHCCDIELLDDGSARLKTDYSSTEQLCSLVLSFVDDARIEEPPELQRTMLQALERVEAAHRGDPPELAAPAEAATAGAGEEASASGGGTGADQPQVEPERFSLLAQTIAYLLDKLDDEDEVTLPVEQVCADLGFDRRELEQAVELLRIVNTGAGFSGYLVWAYVEGDDLRVTGCIEGDLLRRPVRLSPREARAMLLAIDLVGRQTLGGHIDSLESAREKILAASGGLDESTAIPVEGFSSEDFDICRAINRGLAEQRLVEIEYLSREGAGVETRVIEPYLLNRVKQHWYLAAWCRERDGERTFLLDMIKSARLLDESFEPRDIDLARFRKDPRTPSGREAPHVARVWFSPRVARFVLEERQDAETLADGSLVCPIPYFSSRWMLEQILKYQGDAVVLAPQELRAEAADAAARLAAEYS